MLYLPHSTFGRRMLCTGKGTINDSGTELNLTFKITVTVPL